MIQTLPGPVHFLISVYVDNFDNLTRNAGQARRKIDVPGLDGSRSRHS
jgi:hypothetical protein